MIKLLPLLIFVATMLSIWGIGTIFAESISNHKVIKPKPGIECVVVSRMFNTSVDCWRVNS